MHRCEEASEAYTHLKTTVLYGRLLFRFTELLPSMQGGQGNIVILFVKLMERPFLNGKINGAFEC